MTGTVQSKMALATDSSLKAHRSSTIADFVADLRAPTPSAGAELAVFDIMAFNDMLNGYKEALKDSLIDAVTRKRDRYEKLALKLQGLSPGHKLREQRMRYISLLEHLQDSMNGTLKDKRHLLDIRVERLEALSPLKRLSSGYAFVQDDKGRALKSVKDINVSDELKLSLKDGELITEVKKVISNG